MTIRSQRYGLNQAAHSRSEQKSQWWIASHMQYLYVQQGAPQHVYSYIEVNEKIQHSSHLIYSQSKHVPDELMVSLWSCWVFLKIA